MDLGCLESGGYKFEKSCAKEAVVEGEKRRCYISNGRRKGLEETYT